MDPENFTTGVLAGLGPEQNLDSDGDMGVYIPFVTNDQEETEPIEIVFIEEALPLQFLSFGADFDEAEKHVEVNWLTASEVNNDFFIVERAFENGEFIEIDRVLSAPSKSGNGNYDLIDKNIDKSGTYLYRIKQIDNDGLSTSTDIISVDVFIPVGETFIELSPNPSNGEISLKISSDLEIDYRIELYNRVGQLMIDPFSIAKRSKAPTNYTMDLTRFTPGVYILKIQEQNEIYLKRIVIVK